MGSLINLNPALEVALLGALLALLPVAVVARRAKGQGLKGWPAWQRVLTVLTLFLTLDLVVFGAFTRLTDSGLGCPDWPGCYGETSPFAAHAQISAAHDVLPTGPVSHSKAWIEMVHRYLATAVGALITGLMVMAWAKRRQAGLSPWWATGTFIWVCAQGAFGALTVTLKLQPIIVTGHLIGAMLGVALLTAQVRVLDGAGSVMGSANGACMLAQPRTIAIQRAWATSSLRRWGWALLALLTVQIALGAWVSTNYAVLACTEVPMCQGQWWPEMDFAMAFHLLRPLGGDGQGAFITLAALTAIHVAHRMLAVLVLIALVVYGWALRRWSPVSTSTSPSNHTDLPWRRDGVIMWALAAWQLASGLSNVVLGWPLAAALGHTFGAALLVWRLMHVLVSPRGPDAAALAAEAANPTAEHVSPPLSPELRHHRGLHAGASQPSASS